MIRFAKPDITEQEIEAVSEVLRSGWLTSGPLVEKFAEEIAIRCDADHAVCYDSCTAALEMALRALDVGPGDEVITTPYTFSSTAEVIRNVGAKIVFCDLRPGSFEMDYALLGELITENTKAVIPVDFGGVPCNYAELYKVVYDKGGIFNPSTTLQRKIGHIAIIADAAHSFGAKMHGFPVGTIADFTCFSFHVLKSITTGGEGGALVWNDIEGYDNKALVTRLSKLGDHGTTNKNVHNVHGREWEYDVSLFGYNNIMTDVDAASGLIQLDRFDEIERRREHITEMYYDHLPDNVEPSIQHFGSMYKSAMHLFPVRIPGAGEAERDKVFAKMMDAGVQCNVHYKPLPMMTAYMAEGFSIEDYPEAYDAYKNLITLPYHTFLTDDEIVMICNTLREAVDSL